MVHEVQYALPIWTVEELKLFTVEGQIVSVSSLGSSIAPPLATEQRCNSF